jgi:hypothetical protein
MGARTCRVAESILAPFIPCRVLDRPKEEDGAGGGGNEGMQGGDLEGICAQM